MEFKWIFITNDKGDKVRTKCFIIPKKCECKPRYKIIKN